MIGAQEKASAPTQVYNDPPLEEIQSNLEIECQILSNLEQVPSTFQYKLILARNKVSRLESALARVLAKQQKNEVNQELEEAA